MGPSAGLSESVKQVLLTHNPTVPQLARRARGNTGSGRGSAPAFERPWTQRLIALHRVVRRAVLKTGREGAGITNAKGDAVKVFDLAANDAALEFLARLSVPLRVESEEAEPFEFGVGTPRHRLVLDPVDGSDNWARGLPLSALACAVMPINAPLHPESVESAMVGPLDKPVPLVAEQGAGAWRGAARLATSGVRCIADAVISVELNHFAPSRNLARMMADARGVRSYGCASRAVSLVAAGAVDAHVDVRERLTPESYLAAARLLIEAGGCVVGLDGAPLSVAHGLTDGIALVAASNRALSAQIVDRLSGDAH